MTHDVLVRGSAVALGVAAFVSFSAYSAARRDASAPVAASSYAEPAHPYNGAVQHNARYQSDRYVRTDANPAAAVGGGGVDLGAPSRMRSISFNTSERPA